MDKTNLKKILNNHFKIFLQRLIKLYQWTISPLLAHPCRFFPTCSQYTLEAIHTYGIVRGLYLGFKRILRCQPFCDGGIDPLPSGKNVEKSKHE